MLYYYLLLLLFVEVHVISAQYFRVHVYLTNADGHLLHDLSQAVSLDHFYSHNRHNVSVSLPSHFKSQLPINCYVAFQWKASIPDEDLDLKLLAREAFGGLPEQYMEEVTESTKAKECSYFQKIVNSTSNKIFHVALGPWHRWHLEPKPSRWSRSFHATNAFDSSETQIDVSIDFSKLNDPFKEQPRPGPFLDMRLFVIKDNRIQKVLRDFSQLKLQEPLSESDFDKLCLSFEFGVDKIDGEPFQLQSSEGSGIIAISRSMFEDAVGGPMNNLSHRVQFFALDLTFNIMKDCKWRGEFALSKAVMPRSLSQQPIDIQLFWVSITLQDCAQLIAAMMAKPMTGKWD